MVVMNSMNNLAGYTVACPYCGESFETSLDASQGNQSYIEDCYVCCRPIQFNLAVDYLGEVSEVRVSRDDE